MRKLMWLVIMFVSWPAFGQNTEFNACIAALQNRAIDAGLAADIVQQSTQGIRPQAKVLQLDRSQPEFVQTFSDYYYRRVTEGRIARGRALLSKHQGFLNKLTRQYGIPGHYLMAFWGLETNFGTYLGSMPILSSLATLACDNRRAEFFSNEFIAALTLLVRDSHEVKDLTGSWAGAMGHTQFMPSVYMKYAIDGDRDDAINLWRSEKDALASAANYLRGIGWQRNRRWGREVLLARDFPYELSGLAESKSLQEWQQLGVRLIDGSPLPNEPMSGSLILPSGYLGPAFLVYQNFSVIMEWNRSESYALSVGLLADRIKGSRALLRPPPKNELALSRQTIEDMQHKLNKLGFDSGRRDGRL